MVKLNDKWIFWQNKGETQGDKNWEEDLVKVCEFDDTEEFMYILDKIEEGGGVMSYSGLKMFRDPVKPMWEDMANVNGGRVIIDVPLFDNYDIEGIWRNTMAFCISNEVSGICGCVFNEKGPICKISIWVESSEHAKVVTKLWTESVKLKPGMAYYFAHKRTMEGMKSKGGWGRKVNKIY